MRRLIVTLLLGLALLASTLLTADAAVTGVVNDRTSYGEVWFFERTDCTGAFTRVPAGRTKYGNGTHFSVMPTRNGYWRYRGSSTHYTLRSYTCLRDRARIIVAVQRG